MLCSSTHRNNHMFDSQVPVSLPSQWPNDYVHPTSNFGFLERVKCEVDHSTLKQAEFRLSSASTGASTGLVDPAALQHSALLQAMTQQRQFQSVQQTNYFDILGSQLQSLLNMKNLLASQLLSTASEAEVVGSPKDVSSPQTSACSARGTGPLNNPLYKTELCRSWEELGSCRYGSKCQFAHGREELRPVQRHPKYKTEVCRTFAQTGTCPYGTRCRFIHHDASLASLKSSRDSSSASLNMLDNIMTPQSPGFASGMAVPGLLSPCSYAHVYPSSPTDIARCSLSCPSTPLKAVQSANSDAVAIAAVLHAALNASTGACNLNSIIPQSYDCSFANISPAVDQSSEIDNFSSFHSCGSASLQTSSPPYPITPTSTTPKVTDAISPRGLPNAAIHKSISIDGFDNKRLPIFAKLTDG